MFYSQIGKGNSSTHPEEKKKLSRNPAPLGKSAQSSLGILAVIFAFEVFYNGKMIGGKKPLFLLDEDCQILTKLVIEQVRAVGMQTVCSFDLEAVRSSSSGFCCPTHGTAHCTCQLVILLIFGRHSEPLTMTMEGVDHQTWVYLEPGQGVVEEQVDPSLITALFQAFNNKGLLSH